MELDRVNEDHETKFYQVVKEKRQLEDKLEFQYNKTEYAEKSLHEMEMEMMNINSILIQEKETTYKKEMRINQLEDERTNTCRDI